MEIDRSNEDIKEKSGELDHQSEPKILHDSQGTQSDSHRSDKNELKLSREIDRGGSIIGVEMNPMREVAHTEMRQRNVKQDADIFQGKPDLQDIKSSRPASKKNLTPRPADLQRKISAQIKGLHRTKSGMAGTTVNRKIFQFNKLIFIKSLFLNITPLVALIFIDFGDTNHKNFFDQQQRQRRHIIKERLIYSMAFSIFVAHFESRKYRNKDDDEVNEVITNAQAVLPLGFAIMLHVIDSINIALEPRGESDKKPASSTSICCLKGVFEDVVEPIRDPNSYREVTRQETPLLMKKELRNSLFDRVSNKFMIQGGDVTNFDNPLFKDFKSKVVQQVEDAISFTKTGDLIEKMLLKETGAKILKKEEGRKAPSDYAAESIVMPRLSTMNRMNASVEEGVEKTLGDLGFIKLKYEDNKFTFEESMNIKHLAQHIWALTAGEKRHKTYKRVTDTIALLQFTVLFCFYTFHGKCRPKTSFQWTMVVFITITCTYYARLIARVLHRSMFSFLPTFQAVNGFLLEVTPAFCRYLHDKSLFDAMNPTFLVSIFEH